MTAKWDSHVLSVKNKINVEAFLSASASCLCAAAPNSLPFPSGAAKMMSAVF